MDDPLKTRIVGGYMPKSRPWMALIELKQLGGRPGHYNQCGGSIINKVQIKYFKHNYKYIMGM